MTQVSNLVSNHPADPPKRIGWVDAAKGIGILLVVLGHNQINSYTHLFHFLIYSFHMPLFFILAGMFLKPEQSFWTLTKRRFLSTLRPYLLIIVIIYAIYLFFSTMSITVILPRMLKLLFYSLPNYYETWMPLWFLPHIFLLSLFAWIIVWLVYKRLGSIWLRLPFLAGMLFCGVLVLNLSSKINFMLFDKLAIKGALPWSADLLLITGAFFLIGYELRRSLPDAVLASKWTILISAIVWLGLCFAFPYELDLAGRRYDFFPVVTLEIISACLLVFSLSYHLEKLDGKFFQYLSILGKYSIIILIFHGPIQFAVFYKALELLPNIYLAASVAFLAGVGIPVLFCEFILRGNPRLAGWFGLSFA
jgi:fucose 4-O-acetylase-like acetyltransferase